LAARRARTHPARTGTQCPEEGIARRPPKSLRGYELWNLHKFRNLGFSAQRALARPSQPDTLPSHSPMRETPASLRRTTAPLRALRLPLRPAPRSLAALCCSVSVSGTASRG